MSQVKSFLATGTGFSLRVIHSRFSLLDPPSPLQRPRPLRTSPVAGDLSLFGVDGFRRPPSPKVGERVATRKNKMSPLSCNSILQARGDNLKLPLRTRLKLPTILRLGVHADHLWFFRTLQAR